MFKWGQDIGIDLGTATVIAYVKGKGYAGIGFVVKIER